MSSVTPMGLWMGDALETGHSSTYSTRYVVARQMKDAWIAATEPVRAFESATLGMALPRSFEP